MSLWALLERAAALHPRRVAVVDGPARRTYAELARRARAQALWLRSIGCGDGARVAILERNSCAYVEAYFAAAGAGAILVPLNVRLAAPELAAILRASGARVLLARADLAPQVEAVQREPTPLEHVAWIGGRGVALDLAAHDHEALATGPDAPFEPAAVAPDAVAQLYFTSGTTGRPKGVMLTHRNVRAHALAAIAELSLGAGDVWAHVAPMFHLADAWATFALTWVGGRHAIAPRFDEAEVLALFERERVTLTNLIPTMLGRLVRAPEVERRDLSSLRLVLSGGAPIAPALVRRTLEAFRCEYAQTYGMTETSPYLTLGLLTPELRALPPDEQLRMRAKTGRPFLAVELRVLGDDGAPVPPDGRTVGEIHARGETVTPGYWQDPEATAAAFRDGWLATGDLATLDAHGFLDIVDRRKDMIITGGEKVYSTEVEHALHEHPAVAEVAVYGAPDPEWGEAVRAAVALREGAAATADELIAFCRARLAAYKAPRSVRFLAELPKTGSGKIAKRLLREP